VTSFRIASFNVENLNHPGAYFAGRKDSAPYDDTLYADKLGWIGRILDEGRVDIVGFQELFSHRSAKEAVAASRYMSQGGGATLVAPTIEGGINERTRADGTKEVDGPNVGLATRFKVLSHESIVDFPASVDLRIPTGLHDDPGEIVKLPIKRFERPVLKVRLELPGGIPATVFVAHLKSKRGRLLEGEDRSVPVVEALGRTRSLIVRAAEAVALRTLVTRTMDDSVDGKRGEPVILLGDLNDDLSSVTTQVVAGEEPPRYWGKEVKQRLWDVQLYSVHDIQEERSYRDVSFSHIYNGRYELLDHLFVSQEFVRQFPERIGQVANTRIFNDHLVDSRLVALERGPLPAAGAARLKPPGTRSDHGIPVTEIELVGPQAPAGGGSNMG